MFKPQILEANRHILAYGPRAVSYATGGLVTHLMRDEQPHSIYIRQAPERTGGGMNLTDIDFIHSPMMIGGGIGGLHAQFMALARPEERADLEVFMRSAIKRTQHAGEAACRPITWHGSAAEIEEVLRLCAQHHLPEPGPRRTVDQTTFSVETYLQSESMVDTIRNAGVRVLASDDLVARVREAVSQWLRSLDMDPESADGRAAFVRVMRDDLPLKVFQETKTLGEMGRSEYLTAHTLLGVIAEKFPDLEKRAEERLGGKQTVPTWWRDKWLTIKVADPAASSHRLQALCNEILLTARNADPVGMPRLLRVFFEPGTVCGNEAVRGVESLLREGRKPLIGVVLMGRELKEIDPLHKPHIASYFTDRPLEGEDTSEDPGVWYTPHQPGEPHRLSATETKASDQLFGHQLIERGHYQAETTIASAEKN